VTVASSKGAESFREAVVASSSLVDRTDAVRGV